MAITTKQTPGKKQGTGSGLIAPPVVTFTTDFGSGSPLVAAMKGVVLAGCPTAVLVDVSHEVPRFDVSAGAFMLFAGTRHFGGGSVHLAVVDPGVGSTRRRLIVQAGGRFYIGPDNGLFAIVIDEVGVQAVHELAPRPHSAPTFEGRDVFAPAAAALAAQHATSTIPIVFVQVTDPVSAGFVSSLSAPSGNVTGFANFGASVGGERIRVLHEIALAAAPVDCAEGGPRRTGERGP